LIPKGAFKTKLIKISEEYYDGSNQCVDRWVFPKLLTERCQTVRSYHQSNICSCEHRGSILRREHTTPLLFPDVEETSNSLN